MIREVLASPIRFSWMLGDRRPLYQRITEIILRGQGTGEIRDDIDAKILGIILNTAVLATAARVGFSLPGGYHLDEWVKDTFIVLWDGIASDSSRS